MSWYNSKGEKAPDAIRVVRDGKLVWRSNPAGNAEWREANGYTFDHNPVPPSPRTEFTKLEIRLAMRALGWEDTLDALIASSERATKEWRDAQVINITYPAVVQAIEAAGITAEEIEAIRQKIEEGVHEG